MSLTELSKFVLEGNALMVFFLVGDVPLDLLDV
jgi:hypothetical protein